MYGPSEGSYLKLETHLNGTDSWLLLKQAFPLQNNQQTCIGKTCNSRKESRVNLWALWLVLSNELLYALTERNRLNETEQERRQG